MLAALTWVLALAALLLPARRAAAQEPQPPACRDVLALRLYDFADTRSLARALAGVEQLVLSCADDPRRVAWETSAVDAARAAGVGRIVKLSTIGAVPGAPVAFWDWHGQVEEHVHASGVPAVVLRSSFYMTNLLADAGQIVCGHEHRHQLVTALPDLGTNVLVADVIAEIGKRFLPRAGVRVHRVDQRAIDVEDDCVHYLC